MQDAPYIHFVAVVAIFAVGFFTAKPFVDGRYGKALMRWTKFLFGTARRSPSAMTAVIFLNNLWVYSMLLSLAVVPGGAMWLLPVIGANMYVLTAKSEELTEYIRIETTQTLPGAIWFLAMAGFLMLEVGTLIAGAAHSLEQSLADGSPTDRLLASWHLYGWAGAATLLAAAVLETIAIWMPPEPVDDEFV